MVSKRVSRTAARVRHDVALQVVVGLLLVISGTVLGTLLTPYSAWQLLAGLAGIATILGVILQASNHLQPNESRPPVDEVIDRVEDESPDLGESVIEYLDVLTDEYCRPAFDYMDEIGRTTIEDLVVEVAAARENVATEEVTEDLRNETYAALTQDHLQILEAVGVLEYDREHGRVEMTPAGHRLAAVTGGAEPEETHEYTLETEADVLFNALRNERRRNALRILEEDGSSMDFGELATAVASDENDVTGSQLTDKQRKRVYVSLYQTHVPLLADTGFVSYDSAGGDVQITSKGHAALEYLDAVVERIEADDATVDRILDIIRNERRRRVLSQLVSSNGRSDLTALAESIAAWENEVDVHELTSSQRKRAYVSLYQAHLPKMADLGIVDYNKPRGIVELTKLGEESFDVLRELPDGVDGRSIDSPP